MAQRIQNSLLPSLSSSTSTTSSLSRFSNTCTSSSLLPLPQPASRSFSTSGCRQTRLRRTMFNWLEGKGAELKHHVPGELNYLTHTNKPFPLNEQYRSEPILSEALRNEIYDRVIRKKQSVRGVSVEFGVDMRRVGAVVRLVELENRMRDQGKSLALPYARAVHEMVPTTPYVEGDRIRHESINDLPVHRLTDPQIFYPVSESREFNRFDAGRAFSAAPALPHKITSEMKEQPDETIRKITQGLSPIETVGKREDEQQVLLPADARIPHPHMIVNDRNRLTIGKTEPKEVRQRYRERLAQESERDQYRKDRIQQHLERTTQKVEPENSRFEFRFRDVVVSRETTGPTGRGHLAPGRRYGIPSYDRKKGEVKIPTRVDV
ncbi:mitochondrial 37S ribosomal protein mS45 [Aspergillus saccharolyticus JOP 1030-1]|uniref:Ribosomal protein S35, mitochondrial n=1 Tax=Aspergillus saccharolyticus JOP 1030-1 TaxID=1450539 RepID=A0A318Z5H1_9EURO|nr:hypothetical protein BP01DRAFT_327163 [Aspergillus saccharolyticus JOP 1030-1]PYH41684.1 hypothetical protein BP01DRAFT_327163 [Aspergillus saccharolyticus JOP 1030-1]